MKKSILLSAVVINLLLFPALSTRLYADSPEQDIYLYQGIFYFGKTNACLELKETITESLAIIRTFLGNDIIDTKEITIHSFRTGDPSKRMADINCYINDKKYRLAFIATSLKQINRMFEKNEDKGNGRIYIESGEDEVILPPGVEKSGKKIEGTSTFTIADYISMFGEYKLKSRISQRTRYDRKLTMKNEKTPIGNISTSIKVYRSLSHDFCLQNDNDFFWGGDLRFFKWYSFWPIRYNNYLIVKTETSSAEFRNNSYFFLNGNKAWLLRLYREIPMDKYYDLVEFDKVF